MTDKKETKPAKEAETAITRDRPNRKPVIRPSRDSLRYKGRLHIRNKKPGVHYHWGNPSNEDRIPFLIEVLGYDYSLDENGRQIMRAGMIQMEMPQELYDAWRKETKAKHDERNIELGSDEFNSEGSELGNGVTLDKFSIR